jgi:plasmid stabilization system protein ParE
VSITLTPEAEQELVEGALFYAREANAELGRAFLLEFERSAKLLAEQPKLGSLWRGQIRRLPLRRFPYNVVYHLNAGAVRILAVAHQSRKPGFWRGRS